MSKAGWKTIIVAAAPILTAFAAVITALLGQGGLPEVIREIRPPENEGSGPEGRNESKPSLKFFCQKSKGGLSTVVDNPKIQEPIKIINWDMNNDYFGDEWPPEKRCEVVSERFQLLYDRDELQYITADNASWETDKEMSVICSIPNEGARCQESALLFTLQRQDDPNDVLSRLIAVKERPRTNKPLLRGEDSSFEGGMRIYYDMKKILGVTNVEAGEVPAF